ncbi:ankyrin repeat-containing protein [Anaeramoeba ignava]|uniref:Ankyrin repeat-containing protein n=1 Tax=Anaeramoeba ignava TaxID=1746090 RepID=A0A9Q0LCG8_ANAIG|nr:ankyrin repeat-containing protein [Anaeramoeba ignava]
MSGFWENVKNNSISLLKKKEKELRTVKNSDGETLLHYACIVNPKIPMLKFLINNKISVNEKQNLGQTPLHYCCMKTGDLEAIKFLVKNGAKIGITDIFGRTPMHYAASRSHSLKVLNFIFEKGGDLAIMDKTSHSVLDYIFSNSDNFIDFLPNLKSKKYNKSIKLAFPFVLKSITSEKVIDFFLSQNVDLDKTTESFETGLHLACKNNLGFDCLRKLITSQNVSIKTSAGSIPLHILVANETVDPKSVKILITDTTVNSRDSRGRTALMIYLQNKSPNMEVLELLVTNQNINLSDNYASTALIIECSKANISVEIVKLLLSKGASVDVKKNGLSPFFLAMNHDLTLELAQLLFHESFIKNEVNSIPPFLRKCKRDFKGGKSSILVSLENRSTFEKIKLLIDSGADLNVADNKGTLPIHAACKQNYPKELLELLVSHGNDVNAKDNRQNTPLHLACQNNSNPDIVFYLIQKGANVNAKNSEMLTPLFYCITNNFQSVNLLVEAGAELNYQEPKKGKTLLHMVSKSKAIAGLLIQNGADFNILDHSGKSVIQDLDQSLADVCVEKGLFEVDYPHFRRNSQNSKKLDQLLSFQNDWKNFFVRGEFSDSSIKCLDGSIPVHSLILRLRFSANNSDLDDDSNDIFKMEHFINAFQETTKENAMIFLKFIYSAQIQSIESLNKIMEIGEEIGFDQKWIKSKFGKRSLIQDFSRLLEHDKSKNFTIKVENQEIKVHKCVISCRSDLFRGMFLSVKDDSDSVNDYSGKTFEAMEAIIRFLYIDSLPNQLSKQSIEQLQDAKDYYQFNEETIFDSILENLK